VKQYVLLIAALFSFAGSLGLSQETTATASSTAETSTSGLLRLWFRDSERGTAIRPTAILLDGRPVFSQVDETGHTNLTTTEGDHNVVVHANGYDTLDSKQTAFGYDAPMNVLMLDPAQKTDELRPENLSRHMKDDSGLIVGFVVDDEASRPIEGADVEVTGSPDFRTKADARGFFALHVPLKGATPMPDDAQGRRFVKTNFKVTCDGYGYEERLNVVLESGSPKIFQIRLVPGGGGNALDEEEDRGGLQSWIFGVPKDGETTGPVRLQ